VANSPTISVEDLPRAAPMLRAAPPIVVPSATSTADRVDAELSLVERARDALASDPATALALADRHASEFPQGQLIEEREVIAIEALMKLGRTAEAQSRALRVLSEHPRTPYRARIERAVHEAP
jgi:hypothetical protein